MVFIQLCQEETELEKLELSPLYLSQTRILKLS